MSRLENDPGLDILYLEHYRSSAIASRAESAFIAYPIRTTRPNYPIATAVSDIQVNA